MNEPNITNDRLPAYLKSNKYLMMQAAMQTGRVGSQTSLHHDESNPSPKTLKSLLFNASPSDSPETQVTESPSKGK